MPSITPVGIDLGTSFCAISWIDANGQSQMVPNDRGELLTPSVVYFGDDQVAVGAAAADAAMQGSDRVAANVKRDMGSEAFRESINGQHYPPEVIQSCILRQLRRDIIATVGEDFAAVITVPAYFDEARRKATLDAAHMSGLPVLDIVNEPTAAALSFGERLGYLSPEGAPNQCLNVLVYDLGGGTFDVSVIRMSAAEIRVLATDGDYELGGENWESASPSVLNRDLAFAGTTRRQRRGSTKCNCSTSLAPRSIPSPRNNSSSPRSPAASANSKCR